MEKNLINMMKKYSLSDRQSEHTYSTAFKYAGVGFASVQKTY